MTGVGSLGLAAAVAAALTVAVAAARLTDGAAPVAVEPAVTDAPVYCAVLTGESRMWLADPPETIGGPWLCRMER